MRRVEISEEGELTDGRNDVDRLQTGRRLQDVLRKLFTTESDTGKRRQRRAKRETGRVAAAAATAILTRRRSASSPPSGGV